MSDQQTQIIHLAAQVEALKIVIGMIDSTLEARGLDRRGVMIDAFDQALAVLETQQQKPAQKRAKLVVKEMQIYLCADGPVSAAMVREQLAEDYGRD